MPDGDRKPRGSHLPALLAVFRSLLDHSPCNAGTRPVNPQETCESINHQLVGGELVLPFSLLISLQHPLGLCPA